MRRSSIAVVLCALFGAYQVAAGSGRNMEQTASGRVALFLMGFIVLSLFVETSLHSMKHYLVHKHQLGLLVVLDKVGTLYT
jgi:hypothetical protein